MKHNLILLAAAALSLAACSTRICGHLEGVSDGEIIVYQHNISSYAVLDTIKTDTEGYFKYKIDIAKAQPEFIYLFYGETRIAGLLVEKGEKITVDADTLGVYSVSGSDASVLLQKVNNDYAQFVQDLYYSLEDGPKMARIYLDHYRSSIRHILSNPYSMTNIPILYETLGDGSPVFNQSTDALFFRSVSDSLKTLYPESRYVKTLDREAQRRIRLLELENKLRTAKELAFPEINLPNIKGEKTALSEVKATAILVHFWDAEDAAQKMLNLDVLLPIYNDYHSRGLEIYSVCVSADKTMWGSVVSAQKLPWINVNGGLSSSGVVLSSYGISTLPNSILIANGAINTNELKTEKDLRKEIDKALRQ